MAKHQKLFIDDVFAKPAKVAKGGKKKTSGPRGPSKLEIAFKAAWSLADERSEFPLASEVVFYPGRRWRLDYAILELRLGIEIQGGTFIGGGHSRGMGQNRDFEKQNAATALGWRVLFADTKMLAPKHIHATVASFLAIARTIKASQAS